MKPSDIPKCYKGVPQSPKEIRIEEIVEYLFLSMPQRELTNGFTDSCDWNKSYDYLMRMARRNLRRWVQSLPEERQAQMWSDIQGKPLPDGPTTHPIAPEQLELPLGYGGQG
jgi:hypothetical protein